jgi:predicted DsbA family dithiol-disulfide isomerase
MKVEIWSDVVCPWCYVGKRRFEQALAAFPHRDAVEVVWRSFELDPSAPAERSGPYPQHLAAKYGVDVDQAQQMIDGMTATAAADGLQLRFDRARGGNTFDAHRLIHLAAEAGLQEAVQERLMRAMFTEGEPIGDAEALVRLVAEVGVDAERARTVLAEGTYADAVRADEEEARQLRITGVPFFVVDRTYGVSGAQSAEILLQVLERAWTDSADGGAVPASVGAPDHSTHAHPAGAACDDVSCAV